MTATHARCRPDTSGVLEASRARALLDSPKVATRARVKTAPSNRAALRPYVNRCREVLRYCCCGRRQKSLHFLGRYKPYKPCLVLAGRRRPDAAAAAREAQLALPRCHRASRARLAGGALAGGSLWPPPTRDADVRALGGPLAGAAPVKSPGGREGFEKSK